MDVKGLTVGPYEQSDSSLFRAGAILKLQFLNLVEMARSFSCHVVAIPDQVSLY